jgi:hypothetical protein
MSINVLFLLILSAFSVFGQLSQAVYFFFADINCCYFRFLLSLVECQNVLFIDDRWHVLPITSHSLHITPLPPKNMVCHLYFQFAPKLNLSLLTSV